MSDPNALLIVLLATTGLTQTSAAALIGVAGRIMRRWIEGVRIPPTGANWTDHLSRGRRCDFHSRQVSGRKSTTRNAN
jgi:hypothetical protein